MEYGASMERWAGRVAVVTGASAGCGYKIAKTLVRHGMIVVGCARNITTIQELADSLHGEKGKLHPVHCDVAQESDIKAVFHKARTTHGRVDVCINNAGLAVQGTLLTGETHAWRTILEVNVLGVAMSTREAVKCFRELSIDDAHVINVCSMAGHKAASNMYAPSKFMVTAITESTRQELRQLGSGIRVSQISPGYVETDFIRRARNISADDAKRVYAGIPHLDVLDIANSIIYILSAPPHVQVHDIKMTNVLEP